jgi:chemotaxis protein MotB
MKLKQLFTVIGASALLVSCVSTKKFKESEAKYVQLSGSYLDMQEKYRALQDEVKAIQAQLDKSKSANAELTARKKALEEQIAGLNDQVEYLRKNSSTAMEQLKDLSVITGAQAESIKKSLENIGAKDIYIKDLQGSIARKDSLNMALVMNLKGALGN